MALHHGEDRDGMVALSHMRRLWNAHRLRSRNSEAGAAMTPEDEIELVARAWDPTGWDWYDRAAEGHPAKPIFRTDALKRGAAVVAAIDQTRRLAGLREAAEAGRSARGDSIAHRTGICMAVEAIEARLKEIERGDAGA